MDDLIRRFRDYQIEWLTAHNDIEFCDEEEKLIIGFLKDTAESFMRENQSAQPERYTKEELRVFQHGISLSLLSKRSAQHWQYDEDTATEIKFLERLYEKVGADMRGDDDG